MKQRELPPSIPLAFYTFLLIIGVILLIGWTTIYLIPQGMIFDPGLFALSSILILFGLAGRFLYSELAKGRE